MADTKDFYFKMFAREYLTSGEVRELPLEAQGILPRLWCVCCLEGSIPSDLEDLSLASGVKVSQLRTHMPSLLRFFYTNADANAQKNAGETHVCGRLYSRRMERERDSRQKVSAGASKAAKAMHQKRLERERQNQIDANAHANVDANAHAAIVNSLEPQVKVKEKITNPRKREVRPKDEPETLEAILGGKGSPTWEAYWKLAAIFGPGKNPAPKTTAKLYAYATIGFSFEHIHEKAQALAANVSEAKYLPQFAKWLDGEGYRNPPTPTNGAPHARPTAHHHRSDTDARYIQQLNQRDAARGTARPDPATLIPDEELHGMF